MELGKQIKFYRERNGLSQEKLAEKIYVSRQSISNWENEKSYPDIHNILQLSVLFNVSLDELVKGDVDMMKSKNEDTRNKMNFWAAGMIIGMVLMSLSIAPALKILDLKGLSIPLIFFIIMLVSAIKAERIKKKNNIQTYSEILAYMDNKEIDKEKLKKEKKNLKKTKVLLMLGSGFITLILIVVSCVVSSFL